MKIKEKIEEEESNDALMEIKENEEEEEESNEKWSDVEHDVLELILKRLRVTDYLQTQDVCSNWRAIVTKTIANKHCTPLPELPIPLFQRYNNPVRCTTFSFKKLFKEFVFNFIKQDLTYHGTVEGWMIMSKNIFNDRGNGISETIFFFNPVTNAIINMPSVLRYSDHNPIFKIIASSKPTDPRCVVVCVFCIDFVFTRVCDVSWTQTHGNMHAGIAITDVEILHEKLYVFVNKSLLLLYDLQEYPIKPIVLARVPVVVRPSLIARQSLIAGYSIVYHVYRDVLKYVATDASSGDLLLIYVSFKAKEYICHDPLDITDCKVFKFDINSEAKWVEINDLGNRLLFVGDSNTLVVSSMDLDGLEEFTRENSIYFALSFRFASNPHIPNGIEHRIGRFCLSDGSTEYFNFRSSSFEADAPISWFVPSFL